MGSHPHMQGGCMKDVNVALGVAAATTQKEVIGAQVVTKTLDTLNQYSGKNKKSGKGDMAASYDFNKSVLSAAYDAKGAIANVKS